MNRKPKDWAVVRPDLVVAGSTAQARNVLEMAIQDIAEQAAAIAAFRLQDAPIADIRSVVDIADRNEYAPQITRVKEWLGVLSHPRLQPASTEGAKP